MSTGENARRVEPKEPSRREAYLVQFTSPEAYLDFRIPELQSLAKLHGIDYINWDPLISHQAADPTNPYLVLYLASDEDAVRLTQRAVLVKAIWHLWAEAKSFEEIHSRLARSESKRLWQNFSSPEYSYRFSFHAFNKTNLHRENVSRIENLNWMQFEGPIHLKGAVDVEIGIHEYWQRLGHNAETNASSNHIWRDKANCIYVMQATYVGRLVALSWRQNLDRYRLSKRDYIGNTSMEAEMSFILANLGMASPGTFVFDPFVGTGSLLLAAAVFKATVGGMDIDGRQFRGNKPDSRSQKDHISFSKVPGLFGSARQYACQANLLDFVTCDLANHPWRQKGPKRALFDAIICDPPYGVRAGAKCLGRSASRQKSFEIYAKTRTTFIDYQAVDRYPPTQPYPLSSVIRDLLLFARDHLVRGGRLVYFLPQALDQDIHDLPALRGLTLLYAPAQPLGKWCRRAVVMERNEDSDDEISAVVTGIETLDMNESALEALHAPNENKSGTHSKMNGKNISPKQKEFRDRYFSKFQN